MASPRVEILVITNGLKESIKSLSDLEKAVLKVQRMKVDIRVDQARIKRDLLAIEDAIERLTRGEKNVSVNIYGVDRVVSSLEEAQKIQEGLIALQEVYRTETDTLNAELAQGTQAKREMVAEEKANAEAARQTAQEYERMCEAISSMGQALQGLGNVSMSLHDFAKGIGEQFSAIANMFNLNVFDTAGRELTRLATQSLVGDFSKIMSRYDIMSTFMEYMKLAGVESDAAADALQRVNDSILGLPIGLDESAQRLRRYQMFMGDIESATNLTIGLQKALYAGGANEQMRNTALYQIDRLLSSGELATAKQWMSLINGLGVSVRFLAEEMGTDAGTLASSLADGSISTQQFLDALIALGEGSSEAARELDEALGIYKGTLESWISNIRFAAVRGGETILKSLNSALTNIDGNGIVQYMERLRGAMNDMYKGIGGFITGNPVLLMRNMDAVERLFAAIDRFSASRIAEGIFNNLARGVDMLSAALNKLPVGLTEQFVVFATTLAGPLGKLFQTIAAGAPIVLGIFNRFKNFDFERLLDRIIREVERLANVVTGLLNIFPDEVLTEIMAFGLVWGKPVAAVLNSIGSALMTVGAAIAFVNTGGLTTLAAGFSGLAKLVALHPAIAATAGAVAALGVAVMSLHATDQRYKHDLFESLGLYEIDKHLDSASHAIERVNNLLSEQDTALSELGKNATVAKGILDEIGSLNASGSADDLQRMAMLIEQIQTMYPKIKLETLNTGHLSKAGEAARKAAYDFIELSEALRKVEVANQYLGDIASELFKIRIDKELLKSDLEEVEEIMQEHWNTMAKIAEKNQGDPLAFDFGNSEYRDANAAYDEAAKRKKELIEKNDELTESEKGLEKQQAVVNEMLREGESAADQYAGAEDALNGILDNTVNSASNAATALKELGEAYDAAREKAESFIDGQINRFEELEKAAATSLKEMERILENNLKIYNEYNQNSEKAFEFLLRNPTMPGLKEMLSSITEMGLEGAPQLAAVVDAMENDLDGLKSYLTNWGLADEAQKQMTDLYIALAAGMTPEQLYDVFSGKTGGEASPELAEKIMDTIWPDVKQIKPAMQKKQKELVEAMGLEWDEEAGDILHSDKIKASVEQSVEETDLTGAGQKLAEGIVRNVEISAAPIVEGMANALSEADTEGISNALAEKTEEIVSGIAEGGGLLGENGEELLFGEEGMKPVLEALDKLGEVLTGEDGSLYAHMDTLQQQMEDITEKTIPEMIKALDDLKKKLEEVTQAVDDLKEAMKYANDMTNKWTGAIKRLTSAVDAARQPVQNLTGDIRTFTSEVNAAISAVQELASAMAGLGDLSVSVPSAGGGGSFNSMASGNRAVERASGGLVYLAGGGSFWKPRGTDTVPAMLTPGEFVMRKSAVQKFGTAFMDRINSLDIGAAIQMMYRRFPQLPTYVPFYHNVDNRRTYDNHATVNQNIYTNNPDYAYRRASRWAHGL